MYEAETAPVFIVMRWLVCFDRGRERRGEEGKEREGERGREQNTAIQCPSGVLYLSF